MAAWMVPAAMAGLNMMGGAKQQRAAKAQAAQQSLEESIAGIKGADAAPAVAAHPLEQLWQMIQQSGGMRF